MGSSEVSNPAAIPAPASEGVAKPDQRTSLREVRRADLYVVREGPLGPLVVSYGELGITCCEPGTDTDGFAEAYATRFGRPVVADPTMPRDLSESLDLALRTGRLGELAVDLRSVTPFQAEVLRFVATIPPGEVRSYAQVAAAVDRPGAVRAVGTAVAVNPVPVLIPCHRVVRSDGSLGNYRYGPEMKRALLVSETLR